LKLQYLNIFISSKKHKYEAYIASSKNEERRVIFKDSEGA